MPPCQPGQSATSQAQAQRPPPIRHSRRASRVRVKGRYRVAIGLLRANSTEDALCIPKLQMC
eukprot:4672392-Karenia_brevis.AAC.1